MKTAATLSYAFSVMWLTALSGHCADSPSPCHAFEAQKTISESTSTYTDNRFPWKVTSDLDAHIKIENLPTHTTCSTTIESVIGVYMGEGNEIYFRSSEISNEELTVVDGTSCKETKPAISLDSHSETNATQTLRSMGLCTASAPKETRGQADPKSEESRQAALLKKLVESSAFRDYKAARFGPSGKDMHLVSSEIRVLSSKEKHQFNTHLRYLATFNYKECRFFFPLDFDNATGQFQTDPGSSDGGCGE